MRLMTSVQMKSCSVCGVESVFNARFCAQCGVAFESPETAPPDNAESNSMVCPRCHRPLDCSVSQCVFCGEIVDKKPRVKKKPFQKPREDAPPSEPTIAVLHKMLQPMRFTGPAAWWMLTCALVALVCTGFAFYTNEEQYIVVAICAGGFIFAPFLIIILGYLFALAVICRKEITLVSMSVVALIGLGYLVYIIAHSGMSFSFVSITELLRNENFTKTVITFIISSALLVALYPLIKLVSHFAAESRSVFAYKAETEREIGMRTIDNDTSIRMKTLENDHDTSLKKLDIEEQETRLKFAEIEAKKTASIPLLSHTPQSKSDKAKNSSEADTTNNLRMKSSGGGSTK